MISSINDNWQPIRNKIMNDMDISDFKEMWTTELSDYCFIRLEPLVSSNSEEYVICHIPRMTWVIIEDDDLYRAIEKKMLDAGVRIVNDESEI
jgi:hypothetical protein